MNIWLCKMCRNEQPSYKGKLCENCGYHPYIQAEGRTPANYFDTHSAGTYTPWCYTCGVHRNNHSLAEVSK